MRRTVLYDKHIDLGGRMVEFGGWEMPVQYPAGIIEEHLHTRKEAGLFDISHMGRFYVSGGKSLSFLQHVLTGNAAALEPGRAQYTIIPNNSGGAVDDAYLYMIGECSYILVVNAANRKKDWDHLQSLLTDMDEIVIEDLTMDVAMISLQGPESRRILIDIFGEAALPEPGRNNLCSISFKDSEITIARSGYAGESLGFEFFLPAGTAAEIWDQFLGAGAMPVGLGARDTLRLEAGLPLYGHELGIDHENKEIPIFASSLARFAVSFSPLKGRYLGREALERQLEAHRRIVKRDYSNIENLRRIVKLFEMKDRGIARQGAEVFMAGRPVGWVTSGTVAPYWISEGKGLETRISDRIGRRAVGDLCQHRCRMVL
jgi:aminomethyltransferase